MKRLTLWITVVSMALVMTSTGLAVEKFTVDGIDVIVKTNTANTIVAVQFYLKGGMGYYRPEMAGIEAVLFRTALEGTKNYPKDKLRSELARMGTMISHSAGHDYTSFNMQCLKRYLGESWSIFADVIAHPLCEQSDVDLVKERQQNDIRQRKADPDGQIRLLSDALFYRGHPYAVSPDGTEETVEKFSAEVLLDYHKEHVNKARALVVFVGDVDKQTATELVQEGFGALAAGTYQAPQFPVPGGMTSVEHKLEPRELPTNYVRGYFGTPSPDNIEDAIPMLVGLDILRERLFEEVRTKRNLTYSVYSGMANRRSNYGLLYVTSTDPAEAMSVMFDEVAKMRTEPVPEKDLHDMVKVLTTETLIGEQTNSGQASQLAVHEIVGQGFEMAEKRIELIGRVTPADIRRVMKKYIKDINFCVLGDTAQGQAMIEAVAAK